MKHKIEVLSISRINVDSNGLNIHRKLAVKVDDVTLEGTLRYYRKRTYSGEYIYHLCLGKKITGHKDYKEIRREIIIQCRRVVRLAHPINGVPGQSPSIALPPPILLPKSK